MTDTRGTGEVRIFIEVRYPDLSVFLKDAARYLVSECVFSRGAPALAVGSRARLWLVLPVLNERLECMGLAQKSTEDGVLFEVLEWAPGDRERLWRFVALGWAMLRGAAHPRFQEPPPELAARIDVRTVVQLREAQPDPVPSSSGAAARTPHIDERAGDPWQSPAPGRELAELWKSPSLRSEVAQPWKTPVPVTEVAELRRAANPAEGAEARKLAAPGEVRTSASPSDPKQSASGPEDRARASGSVERKNALTAEERKSAPAAAEKSFAADADEGKRGPPSEEQRNAQPADEGRATRSADARRGAPPLDEKREAPSPEEKGGTPSPDEKKTAAKRPDKKSEAAAASNSPPPAAQRPAPADPGGHAASRPAAVRHLERGSSPPPPLRPTRRPVFEPASFSLSRGSSSSSFEGRSLVHRLAELLAEQKCGCLETFSAGISRQIRFDEGAIVQIEQRPRADLRLLATAMKGVGLDWESVRDVHDRLLHEDMPEQRLVELERLSTEDAELVMSRRLSLQLQRAIESGWEGEASFVEAPTSSSSRSERVALTPWPPVPVARLIWDGLRVRAYDRPERLQEFADTMARRTLAWSPETRFPLHDTFPRSEEQAVLQRLRNDLPGFHQHLVESGQGDRVALAVVWSLIQLGQLESVLHAAEPAPDHSQAALIVDLTRQEREMQSWDHFKALELPWNVHPNDIQPAFDRLLLRYRSYARSTDPELSQVGQAILRRLFAALEVLGHARSRQEYRRRTMGKELLESVDQLMQEGEAHDLKGELKEALRCFERAVDMSPHRADCRDRLARQRKVVEQR